MTGLEFHWDVAEIQYAIEWSRRNFQQSRQRLFEFPGESRRKTLKEVATQSKKGSDKVCLTRILSQR